MNIFNFVVSNANFNFVITPNFMIEEMNKLLYQTFFLLFLLRGDPQ